MKKIITLILVTTFLLSLTLPAVAFSQPRLKPYFARPIKTNFFQKIRPLKSWHEAQAKPGQPVTLEGEGVVRAHGKGMVYYQVDEGRVVVFGKGVIAVKDAEKIIDKGWGGKKQVGDWTFYWGKGILRVKGEDFKLSGWGRFRTLGIGEGKVTFQGNWRICYYGFGESNEHLEEPVELPEELESETGLE